MMRTTDRLRRHAVSYILLLLMFLNLAWSIQAAKWSEGLYLLQWVAILCVTFGFLLGITRWPSSLAHAYMVIVATFLIPFIMVHEISAALSWNDRLTQLVLRVDRWVKVLVQGGVNYDNLVFVFQLALYMWLFGYLSAWGLFRHRKVWWGILPCGFGMLFNLYYAPPKLATYFILYLLLALVLIVRENYQAREGEWEQAKVTYTPDIAFDYLRDGVIIGIIVIVLAWSLPTAPTVNALSQVTDGIQRPWQKVQAEWNRMFGSLTSYYSRPTEDFDRSMVLSGPVELGDDPVLEIEAEQGRYWRAVAYDFYTGRGWLSTYEEVGALGDNATPIARPPYRLRGELEQAVRVLVPATRSIVAAPQLLNIDIDGDATLLYLPRGQSADARPPTDIEAAYARTRLREGDIYRARSSISLADEDSLRQADDELPDWVRDRYLQLPEGLPQRVRVLATQIAHGFDNDYDKATAIEQYLRQIPYNQSISAPPDGWDAVDYFLFESQEGYCDYYASAMVVLARSAGIPSRIARGYARGERIENTAIYRIREKNSHAWVEVYFPQYGWVEFEPTGSEPMIMRPTPAPTPDPGASEGSTDPSGGPSDMERFGPEEDWLGDPGLYGLQDQGSARLRNAIRDGATLLALLLVLIGLAWWLRRVLHPLKLSPVQRAYLRMTRRARLLLGLIPQDGQTPYEYATLLSKQVPAANRPIYDLTAVYVQEQFGAQAPENGALQVKENWKEISKAIWWRSLKRFLCTVRLPSRDGRGGSAKGLQGDDE